MCVYVCVLLGTLPAMLACVEAVARLPLRDNIWYRYTCNEYTCSMYSVQVNTGVLWGIMYAQVTIRYQIPQGGKPVRD